MSDFYVYHQGGWWLAVDAINHTDAAQFVRRIAPKAEYVGRGANIAPKTATGCITDKRQCEIIENNKRWANGF